MQPQPNVGLVRVLIQMVDSVGVELRCTALDAVHLVSFLKE